MTLMNRFARLFKADVNAILDNLEEPELILKQALRDMQAGLASEQKNLNILTQNLQQCNTRLSSVDETHAKHIQEIRLCLDAKNESLAKTFISKKLHIEANLKFYQQKKLQLTESIKIVDKTVAEMRQTIAEIKQKVAVISNRKSTFEMNTMHNLHPELSPTISNEAVEIELLRLQSEFQTHPKQRKTS